MIQSDIRIINLAIRISGIFILPLILCLICIQENLHAQIIQKDTSWIITQSPDTQMIYMDGYLDGENTWDIRSPAGIKSLGFQPMRFVKIENLDTNLVLFPRNITNNKRNWFRYSLIWEEATRGCFTPKEKAMGLYNLLCRYNQHWASAEYDFVNPIVQLCGYGYGLCDDISISIAHITQAAGYPAFIWQIPGHVVSEVDMGDGMQLIDADLAVFYPDYDNSRLVSKLRLNQDRFLARRINHNGKVNPWDSNWNTFIANKYEWNPGTYQFPFFNRGSDVYLKPSESITWIYDQLPAAWHHTYELVSPGSGLDTLMIQNTIGNAISFLPYDMRGEFLHNQIFSSQNLSFNLTDSLLPRIIPLDSALKADIILQVEFGFPILDIKIFSGLKLTTELDTFRIYISDDLNTWTQCGQKTGVFHSDDSISLQSYLRLDSASIVHNKFIKLEWNNFYADSASGLDSLYLQVRFQVSKQFMPALEIGQNTWVFQDSSLSRKVKIDIAWQESFENRPPVMDSLPVFPLHQTLTDSAWFTFHWLPATDPDGDSIAEYHFQLSDRADFAYNIAPNFDRYITPMGSLTPAFKSELGGFLNHQQTYYWRVRARDSLEAWSPWSPVWSFTPLTVMHPENLAYHYTDTAMILSWQPNQQGKQAHQYKVYVSNESSGFYPDSSELLALVNTSHFPILYTDSTFNSAFFRVSAVDSLGEESLVSPAFELPFPSALCPPAVWVYPDSQIVINLIPNEMYYPFDNHFYIDTIFYKPWISPVSAPNFVLWNGLHNKYLIQADSDEVRHMLFDPAYRNIRYQMLAPQYFPVFKNISLQSTAQNLRPKISTANFTPGIGQFFQDTLLLLDGDANYGDVHIWSSIQLPYWVNMILRNDTLILNGTPLYSNLQDTIIEIQVSDSYGLRDTVFIRFGYGHINSPPVITSVPDTLLTTYGLYTYPVQMTDPDLPMGDQLTLHVSVKPNWLNWDSGNKIFYGFPVSQLNQPNLVSFTVVDMMGGVDAQEFIIHLKQSVSPDTTTVDLFSESSEIPDFKMFPNPFDTQFQMHADVNGYEKSVIIIYNSLGQVMQGWYPEFDELNKAWNIQVNPDIFPSGVYWVILINEGEKVYIQKIIRKAP